MGPETRQTLEAAIDTQGMCHFLAAFQLGFCAFKGLFLSRYWLRLGFLGAFSVVFGEEVLQEVLSVTDL